MSETEKFNRGDVVRLKSGGLSMTIKSLCGYGGTHGNPGDEPGANCVWMNEKGKVRYSSFPLEILRRCG
jgi:uncharacterized protein YodC (DUF2158 family)